MGETNCICIGVPARAVRGARQSTRAPAMHNFWTDCLVQAVCSQYVHIHISVNERVGRLPSDSRSLHVHGGFNLYTM
eukprot:207225-Prymnesium_polylepis.1